MTKILEMSELDQCSYFINKFEAIPARQWTIEQYLKVGLFGDQKRCVYGHCGMRHGMPKTDEYIALSHLLLTTIVCCPLDVNDGIDPQFQQESPKARILAALHAARIKLMYQQLEKEVSDLQLRVSQLEAANEGAK